jgi:hypothetical protein
MTIFHVVRSICAPLLLAEVAMLLDANFLWNSGCRLSTRSIVSCLALVGSFLVVLNSLERHKKQTHVHGSHTFLVKVEMILSCKQPHLAE